MTIVLTGGGSGGHIVPILSIAEEIKRQNPKIRVVYIGQKGDGLLDIPSEDANIDQVYAIRAGKFRRFHGEGLKQLLDLPTVYKNIRDVFYVLIGTYQSRKLMQQIKPDVVFSRGGYVSVPVCLGAHFRDIPYITHDSDPVPSLANRLIARWATWHAVALPEENYPYPSNKTVMTGIPLSDNFVPVTAKLKDDYRKKLDIPEKAKVLFIVGGGLGSQQVNEALGAVVPHLMREFKDLYVLQGAGRLNEAEMREAYNRNLSEAEQGRLQLFGFAKDLYIYSGAADIIVTRAGATNLAEFAVQGKACVIIPSAFLVGGHQLKNAAYLRKNDAAIVIEENELYEDPNRLAKQLSDLLRDKDRQKDLGAHLTKFAHPQAAKEIVNLILNTRKADEEVKAQ